MMTLTRLWKRSQQETRLQQPEPAQPESSADGIRFMLLIPEGGFSYRLTAFSTEDAALAYVHENAAALRRETALALRTIHSESAPNWPTDERPEAVVIARNPGRRDAVQLYSFVEMDDARTFARELVAGGMDPGLVLIYWAVPVSLEERLTAAASRTPDAPEAVEPDTHTTAAPEQPTSRGRSSRRRKVASSPSQTPEDTADARDEPSGPYGSSLARAGAKISAWEGWDGLAPLMVSASLLQPDVYAALGRDKHATGRAVLIVGLMAVAAGIAAAGSGLASVLWHVSALLLGWAVYVGAVHTIGTWVLTGRQQPPHRFFQAAGLASSPGLLIAFGGIPVYGPLIVLGASVWVAISVSVAASTVLELRREPALLTSAVGWCLFFAVSQAAPLALV